jgi:hypothetical protein
MVSEVVKYPKIDVLLSPRLPVNGIFVVTVVGISIIKIVSCLLFSNPMPTAKSSDCRSRLEVEWLPVFDLGSDSLHMRYYNIGQVVLGAPNDLLNQNMGPVKLNLAVDLHGKGMTFWDSFDLKEN